MAVDYIERVYETLWGVYEEPYAIPGIKSEFENGSFCMNKYDEVYQANRRICKKLGVDECLDVEIIINSLLDIQQVMCRRMYEIGAEKGMKDILYL